MAGPNLEARDVDQIFAAGAARELHHNAKGHASPERQVENQGAVALDEREGKDGGAKADDCELRGGGGEGVKRGASALRGSVGGLAFQNKSCSRGCLRHA